MKQKLLNSIRLRAMMLVAVMCAAFAGQAWADTYTFNSSIPTTGWTTSGGSQSINSKSWTYSSSTYIGNSSSRIQIGSKNKPQTTAWTIQTAVSNFGANKRITAIEITAYTTAASATYDISAGGSSVKSGSLTTSSSTYTASGLNVTSGNIVITLTGSSTSKAMYLSDISVTYEDAAAPSYDITAVSNNNSYGTVSLSGTTITATPEDGYRVVDGDDGYTVTSGTATVMNNGDNTFSVSPSSDCTVQINFEAIPTYTVSIADPTGGTLVVKNGEVVIKNGDEVEEGTVLDIEASPADGYNYTNWQYKLGDGSWNTKTVNYSTPAVTDNISIRANFAAKVYHNAIFQKYDGSKYVTHATKNTEEGQPIDFAGVSDPADLEGRSFVGWVAAKIESPVDSPEPTFVTSGNMGVADVTYYACYAYCTPGSSATKTDELTTATFDNPSSYTSWSDKQATSGSDAVYAGNTTTNYSTAIQMRDNSDSGIVSTTSGGKAKKVTVTWNSNTTNGRTLNVYGKNTAYTASSDLYDDEKKGTLLGTIVYGTSTEFEITGDYTYIGLRSNSGAMYLDEIDIDWTTGTPDTYSGYCTTVPEDARTAVNIGTFTATNTTLVIGNNSTTDVTNDQVGWTPAYIYTSDNTSIATVSDDGVITAVAKGTANITVTLDIPNSGGSYKKGSTFSKSIEITVTKPFHNVTFMANGSELSSTSVEEDEDIDVPSAPANVGNFSFQGWKEGSAVDGTQSSAPSYATISTMGDADVTYYAVYAVEKDVTATFDASDITATPATGNSREWEHTATGILLYISAGQHYTSGTPNTFTVSKGASNYFSITTPTGGEIKQIVTTISETDYKIGSVTAGGSLSTSGTTQTVTFTNAVNTVNCKATGSYQIRAKTIVVDATLYENFCTTIPAYSVTVGDAGYTTYVAANNVSFPVGATAYIATAVNPSTIHLEEVLAVPTGEAVVVKAAKGTYNLTVESSGDCNDVSDNLLEASDGSVTGDGSYIYALGVGKSGVNKGVVGFYLVNNGQTIPTGKAYLNTGASVKEFLTFDFDDATAIAKIQDSGSKIQDSEIFNLAGQKMSKVQKGLNIVNGKKVLVK